MTGLDAMKPAQRAKPRTAFVLDDAPTVGVLVCKALASLGIEARHFTNPIICLTELRGANPELLVLDLMLGRWDGLEVMRQLEVLKFEGSVLLISGRDNGTLKDFERIGRAHGLAMLPSLQKPFRTADLKRSLAAYGAAPAATTESDQSARSGIAGAPRVSLKEALDRNWLEVWYQPKIDLKTLAVCGAEALLRARHPEHGILAPADFLPPAGDALYQPLSLFVLRRTLADWEILADGGAALRLSVNIPISVIQAAGFVNMVRGLLPDDARFPGLILEVTEDEIIDDPEWIYETATQLRLYGVFLSIDDFGSAYASLARLRDMPFVELKLDHSFVSGCAHKPISRDLCASVLDLAHRFKATLCAEGVETAEDFRCLAELGCDTAQGHLFGKPMPRNRFLKSLRDMRIATDAAAVSSPPDKLAAER